MDPRVLGRPRSAPGSGQRSNRTKKFIYDLPHREHKDIEDLLNINDAWEILAGEHLHLRVVDIDKLRRYNQQTGTSAAKALLDHMSNRNTTIQELFLLLHKIQLYRGMDLLRPYVAPSLHHLVKSGNHLIQSDNDHKKDTTELYPIIAPIPTRVTPNTEEMTRSQNLLSPNTMLQQGSHSLSSTPIMEVDTSIGAIAKNYRPDVGPTARFDRSGHPQGGSTPRFDRSGPPQVGPTARFDRSGPPQQSVTGFSPGSQVSSLRNIERARHISETASTISSVASTVSIPIVSYDELKMACGGWDINNKIGEGGFGQVFKGVWKHQDVAIKIIRQDKFQSCKDPETLSKSIKQCFKEIVYLSSFRSEFIVPILAHSYTTDKTGMEHPCIVYQWMPNGSLDDRLQKKPLPGYPGGTPALTWVQRYKIAKGTANGIQFLHSDHNGKQLVHGDIKSANILLDKNMDPKIGDFGLAREVEDDGSNQVKSNYLVLTTIYGTQFYLPQDFLRSKKLTPKVDTYSFGVILFDLVSGRRPQHKVNGEYLLDIMRDSETLPTHLIDMSWPGHPEDSNLCPLLYKVGKKCTVKMGKKRPDMREVYEELEKYWRSEFCSEKKSPTPYELQMRYDSGGGDINKNDHVEIVDDLINFSVPVPTVVPTPVTPPIAQSDTDLVVLRALTQGPPGGGGLAQIRMSSHSLALSQSSHSFTSSMIPATLDSESSLQSEGQSSLLPATIESHSFVQPAMESDSYLPATLESQSSLETITGLMDSGDISTSSSQWMGDSRINSVEFSHDSRINSVEYSQDSRTFSDTQDSRINSVEESVDQSTDLLRDLGLL